MKIKKSITLEEQKYVQFEMLKEIDTFCRANDIRYSLAFGTLLGAIRHKGFIPWDDDVDIMMPLPEMLRFKQLFHSEKMKYCDVDTEKHYEYGFSRIANVNTINIKGMIVNSYGICIDLYPLVAIPHGIDEREHFFKKVNQLYKHRAFMMKWNSRAIRYLPIKSLPYFDRVMKRYRDFILFTCKYGSTHMYYIVAGPLSLRDKMTYDYDLFEEQIEVEFEGHCFCAIKEYDKYLTMRYGDYMQLPPEEQRHPYHGGHYYWKV